MSNFGRRFAVCFLLLVALTGALADFLANDRPIVARRAGRTEFPVLFGYGVPDWRSAEVSWALWPPVRYSAGGTDLINGNYRPPLAEPRGRDRPRHWLGTDRLGRDTLAGLIHGCRVAVVIGLGSLLVALLIGGPLGAVAGYFGNDGLRWPRYRWWGGVVGAPLGVMYYAAALGPYLVDSGSGIRALAGVLATVLGWGLISGGLYSLSLLFPGLKKPVSLPLDRLVMSLVEGLSSVPGLVVLIALLSFFSRPSLAVIVLVIGGFGWVSVARFLRAELLRIRELPYVEAARVSGVGEWRILLRHALPNALGPLFVVGSFAVGGAVLTESALSFLGIGVPADLVSWGSILRQSREQPAAWWLAVFPGLLLTGVVLGLNYLAEGE